MEKGWEPFFTTVPRRSKIFSKVPHLLLPVFHRPLRRIGLKFPDPSRIAGLLTPGIAKRATQHQVKQEAVMGLHLLPKLRWSFHLRAHPPNRNLPGAMVPANKYVLNSNLVNLRWVLFSFELRPLDYRLLTLRISLSIKSFSSIVRGNCINQWVYLWFATMPI